MVCRSQGGAGQRVVAARGDIWWADPGEDTGSAPAFRRPVLIVQSDAFNRSRIGTVIALVLTSSLRLLNAPANVLVARNVSGSLKNSVANVSQVVTLDRDALVERVGRVPLVVQDRVDDGVRLVLGLRSNTV